MIGSLGWVSGALALLISPDSTRTNHGRSREYTRVTPAR
jgi:hypothetical protein